MALSFRNEIRLAFTRALYELIPPQNYRKPLTWRNVPNAFAYIIPFYFMAFLVRRRDTRLIRLLLLPTIIAMTIRGIYYYHWSHPDFLFLEWIRGLVGLSVIALSIDWAFSEKGRLRKGETTLPALYEDPVTTDENGQVQYQRPHWFIDTTELILDIRGLDWDFGKGVYVPPNPRPTERSAFLKATAVSCLKHFLVVDTLVPILKLIPGANTPAGGSLFFSDLPQAHRYILSTCIAAISATAIISGFQVLHALGALAGVGLLGQSPSQWPPLMQNPWGAHSISDLWAKRWHQMLRRVFLIYGGIPGGWIAGRIGVVLGAFFASGLLHECGIYVIGRGFDHRVTVFFTLQGVCVLLEVLWRKVTGYKVSGWGGRLWVYAVVLLAGQYCVDAWFIRGLLGAVYVPSWLSPTQSIVIPAISSLLNTR